MDITGQIVLAFLEEDDERRVLFRVRPVLTAQGAVNPEDLEEYGEEGFLRVAPDRGEQHSFKERMRSLGKLCVINLQNAPEALFKVRPNKNYAPSRGETNRYVIYSDAVQALPPGMVYEVVPEEKSQSSLTGQYYLRAGGRISGPHCPGGSLSCPTSQILMPDCERLFYVELPDGTSTMFYWPEQAISQTEAAEPESLEPAPAPSVEPAPEAAAEAVPGTVPGDSLETAAQALYRLALREGFLMDEARAAHLTILLAISPRLMVAGDNPADALAFAHALKGLLKAGENGPRILGKDKRAREGSQRERYLGKPWPVFRVGTAPVIPLGGEELVSLDIHALQTAAAQAFAGMGEEPLARLHALLAFAETRHQALPLCLRRQMAKGLALGRQLPEPLREGLFESLASSLLIPYEQVSGLGNSVTAAFLAQ